MTPPGQQGQEHPRKGRSGRMAQAGAHAMQAGFGCRQFQTTPIDVPRILALLGLHLPTFQPT